MGVEHRCGGRNPRRDNGMIRINQLPVNHKRQDLQKKAAKLLRQPETRIRSLHIRRQSIDARKKGELLYIYAVDVEFEGDEESAVRRAKNVNIAISKEKRYQFPEAGREAPRLKERPVQPRSRQRVPTVLRPDACQGRLPPCDFREGSRRGHKDGPGETVLGGGNSRP